jgi:cell division protein FtsA
MFVAVGCIYIIEGVKVLKKAIAAIEFGTTKLAVVIGSPKKDGSMELLGLGTAPYEGPGTPGLRSEETVMALKTVISQTQKMSGLRVKTAVIGIPNEFCGLIRNKQTLQLKGAVVTKNDVQAIRKATGTYELPSEWIIIRRLFSECKIDGQPVDKPVGMSGDLLELCASLICVNKTFVDDAVAILSRCGIDADKAIPVPEAEGDVFLTEQEKHRGAVLVDIGGRSTDISAYIDGLPIYYDWLPIGGTAITADIEKGLGLSLKDAEKLKRNCVLGLDFNSSESEPEYSVRQGKRLLSVPASLLQNIVESRVEELFELVGKSISTVPELTSGCYSVVLTGGGVALLRGAREFASRLLGCPVSLGVPDCIGMSNPAMAAPYALVCSRSSNLPPGRLNPLAGIIKFFKDFHM